MPCGWRWRLIVHQLLVAPLLRRRREQRDRVHLRLSSAVRHNPWASPLLYYSIRCIFLGGRLAAAAATHQHGDLRTAEAPAARRFVRTLYHSTQLWAGSRQNGELHGGGGPSEVTPVHKLVSYAKSYTTSYTARGAQTLFAVRARRLCAPAQTARVRWHQYATRSSDGSRQRAGAAGQWAPPPPGPVASSARPGADADRPPEQGSRSLLWSLHSRSLPERANHGTLAGALAGRVWLNHQGASRNRRAANRNHLRVGCSARCARRKVTALGEGGVAHAARGGQAPRRRCSTCCPR